MPELEIPACSTFGELLKYLRKRAQLTQRELAIAVGYSEGHVSRLEKDQRPPDLATIAALFIPALELEDEPRAASSLMQLAASAHTDPHQILRVSRTRESTEVIESAESIPSNLPIQLTSFIGRQAEITEITALLSRAETVRLVTLSGPGGMGKTRLALQIAMGVSHLFRDGIWFVDLTPLSVPELVPQTVAAALGIMRTPGQPIEETLIAYLRPKQVLILMDNCEHLIHAAAQSVEKIVRSCAQVKILATSREPLNVPGEVDFRVPPLSMPERRKNEDSDLLGNESVQLFLERVSNVQAVPVVKDSDISIVARICRQLDGMPLAIELAAARIKVLSLSQIEDRLHDRFRLLGGGQTTLARHQTLRATIEWSHDLLTEAEKRLFRRLSVFAGGWTLEAGNSVCSENGSDILDLLAQLVNKSLVVVEKSLDGGVRYDMLETLRQYAREQLSAAGELQGLRARHFEYFSRLVEQGEENLFTGQSSIDQAEAEIDNLRAALSWAIETEAGGSHSSERTARGMELMVHVWPLWLSRGYLSEGSEWMEQLLAAHTDPSPARARALTLAADFARYHGDHSAQVAFIEEALTIARELGDQKRIAWSLMEMGLVERDLKHYSEAIRLLTESLEIFQRLNANLWVNRVCFLLAETYITNGDLEAARSLWEKGLELCRKQDDQWHISWGLEGLGHVERSMHHFEEARQLYTESLQLKLQVGDKVGILYSISAFAQLAAGQEQFKRAAVLWGAAEHLRHSLNLLLPPSSEVSYTALLHTTRTQLGDEQFNAAWAEGKTMKFQEVIDYALGEPGAGSSAVP